MNSLGMCVLCIIFVFIDMLFFSFPFFFLLCLLLPWVSLSFFVCFCSYYLFYSLPSSLFFSSSASSLLPCLYPFFIFLRIIFVFICFLFFSLYRLQFFLLPCLFLASVSLSFFVSYQFPLPPPPPHTITEAIVSNVSFFYISLYLFCSFSLFLLLNLFLPLCTPS